MSKRLILNILTAGGACLALGACDMGYPPGGSYPAQAYAAPGYAPEPTPIYESDYPPPVYGSSLNVVIPVGHEHDHDYDHFHGGDSHRGAPPAAFHHEDGHGGGYHPQHVAAPAAPVAHETAHGHGGGEHGGGGHGAPPPSGGGSDRDHGQH
ncbi:MAG TPA: hypothetical protein VL574_11395 [Stellaceae bacterium]|nr:hypothetical protein [Stellaceae bacterium]